MLDPGKLPGYGASEQEIGEEMDGIIRQAQIEDAEQIASIISEANKDVAIRFKLNSQNAPKHPSFCTEDWVKADIERRVVYFLYELDGNPLGCVGFEKATPDTAYMNRLSVLPPARSQGIGEQLVQKYLEFAKEKNIKIVSIGIIAEFIELKNWYLKLGFRESSTQIFEHLPFHVCFMTMQL